MKAECPMGHTLNLSWQELAEKLNNDEWCCLEPECSKEYSYEIDSRFWHKYQNDELGLG